MSGSNSICVATVLLDTGILPMQEPETRFTLEAPGGLIDVTAHCRNGKAERIIDRQRALLRRQARCAARGRGSGTLKVDIAFGGDSFVIVDAAALGFAIRPDEARDLAETGHPHHRRRPMSSLASRHPETTGWDHISFCQFAGPLDARRKRDFEAPTPASSAPARSTARRPAPAARPAWRALSARGLMREGDALSRPLDHRLASSSAGSRARPRSAAAAGDHPDYFRAGLDYRR